MRELITKISDYFDERRNDPQRRDNQISIVVIGAVAVVVIVLLLLLLWGFTIQERKKNEAENQETEMHTEEAQVYMADDSDDEALRQEYLTSIGYLGDKVEELLQTMTQVQERLSDVTKQYEEEDTAVKEQINILNQQINTIVQNLKETQTKLYDLTDIVQILDQEKIPLIQQQIQEIREDMGQVHTDIADIYTQLAALKQEDEKLWAGIDTVEKSLKTALDQNITEVNNQIDVLLGQLETVESRIGRLALNTLQYRYDAASNTLYLMPYQEE